MIDHIDVLPARDLTSGQLARWDEIQTANCALASPYFCREFTQLTAAVRSDVQVGILYGAGGLVGYFPFQRCGRDARPVGGPLSDYQGLIVPADAYVEPKQLLDECGLRCWEFDHLVASQEYFRSYHEVPSVSPQMDLSRGYDAWFGQRNCASNVFSQIERRRRKLEREIGPLRYVSHTTERDVLQTLLRWKSQQYITSGTVDVFAHGWIRELVECILHIQSENFAGILSAVYAGDRLAAVHFGMRSRTIWHYWFPAYDRELSNYSPGLILLLEMARDAEEKHIAAIDLGKTDARYKRQFSNAEVAIAEGRVPRQTVRRRIQQFGTWLAAGVRRTPLIVPARVPARLWRKYRTWVRFR